MTNSIREHLARLIALAQRDGTHPHPRLIADEIQAEYSVTEQVPVNKGTPNRHPSTRPDYVYVASSWRNDFQQGIVRALRARGIDCYDFREPAPGVSGFAWSDIDPDWQTWSAQDYVRLLDDPIAEEGFRRDMDAMERADTFVLVLPCGRSAHLELGWAVGAGKRTIILTRDGEEPELMAKMADRIVTSLDELVDVLGVND